MRGCGELFPDGQRFDLVGSPGLEAVAGILTERGLPLNVHSNEPVGHDYPGKGDNTPGPCFAFASRHPELTIIYAHLGGGLFFYEMMPSVRKALGRVFYDTSAAPYLYRADVYQLAAQAAGREKLVFGTRLSAALPGPLPQRHRGARSRPPRRDLQSQPAGGARTRPRGLRLHGVTARGPPSAPSWRTCRRAGSLSSRRFGCCRWSRWPSWASSPASISAGSSGKACRR